MDTIFCDTCGRGLFGTVENGKLTVQPCGACAREADTCRYCVEHGRTCCSHLGCTCEAPSSCPYCGAPKLEDEDMTYGPEGNDTGHVEYLCHTWWDNYSTVWIDKVCKYIRSLSFNLEHPGLHLLEPIESELHEHDENCGCQQNQAEPEELRATGWDFDMRDSKGKGLDEMGPQV